MIRQSQNRPIADEVVAEVADRLMNLALEFESTHLGEILRYRQQLESLEPTWLANPQQLPLFPELPPF